MNVIAIKNFKSIDECGINIHLAPITLLYGRNCAGKSVILQALSLASRIIQGEKLTEYEFLSLVHKCDAERTIRISMTDRFVVCINKEGSKIFDLRNEDEMTKHFMHVGHPRPNVSEKHESTMRRIFGEEFVEDGEGRGQRSLRPVIDAINKCQLVAIENPEDSIHPRYQPELAEVLLETVERMKSTIIVETHSELMMLRWLRKIRDGETMKENFTVTYLRRIGGITVPYILPLTDDGDFYTHWPEGFFDERTNEIFGE